MGPRESEFRAKHLVGEPSTQEALWGELRGSRISFEENQVGVSTRFLLWTHTLMYRLHKLISRPSAHSQGEHFGTHCQWHHNTSITIPIPHTLCVKDFTYRPRERKLIPVVSCHLFGSQLI